MELITITVRPFEEWSIDELITLEDDLRSGWDSAPDEFPYSFGREPEVDTDGSIIPGAPNLADWYEHTLREIDRVLTAAGYTVEADSRWGGWRRQTPHDAIRDEAAARVEAHRRRGGLSVVEGGQT